MPPTATLLTNSEPDVEKRLFLMALIALKQGDFSVRLPNEWTGIDSKIADTFNEIVALNSNTKRELNRLSSYVSVEDQGR